MFFSIKALKRVLLTIQLLISLPIISPLVFNITPLASLGTSNTILPVCVRLGLNYFKKKSVFPPLARSKDVCPYVKYVNSRPLLFTNLKLLASTVIASFWLFVM